MADFYDYDPYAIQRARMIESMNKARSDLAKKQLDVFEEVSVSSIAQKIEHQYLTFVNLLSKAKLPLKIIEVTKDSSVEESTKHLAICINKNKNNKPLPTYSWSPYNDLGTTELVLTPEEIAAGITLFPGSPTLVLMNGVSILNDVDSRGNTKFRIYYTFDGRTVPYTNSSNLQLAFHINPDYIGPVNYKTVYPNKKIEFSPCIIKDKDNVKWIKGKVDISLIANSKNPLPSSIHKCIKMLTFVKINKYDQSAALFGYSGIKKEMFQSNTLFNIADILINFKCRKDGKVRDVVELCYKGKTYKFLGEELEFIYPDIEEVTKGYSLPKDRTIKAGVICKVKDDRSTKLNKEDEVVVVKKVFKEYFEVTKDDKKYIINKKQLKVK